MVLASILPASFLHCSCAHYPKVGLRFSLCPVCGDLQDSSGFSKPQSSGTATALSPLGVRGVNLVGGWQGWHSSGWTRCASLVAEGEKALLRMGGTIDPLGMMKSETITVVEDWVGQISQLGFQRLALTVLSNGR